MISISGPKNASARDSAAMRWPSRQMTASDMAGASLPRSDRAREIGEHQAFGAVRDLRQVSGLPGFSNVRG